MDASAGVTRDSNVSTRAWDFLYFLTFNCSYFLHFHSVCWGCYLCVCETFAFARRQGCKLDPHLLHQLDQITLTLSSTQLPMCLPSSFRPPVTTHTLLGFKDTYSKQTCYLTLTRPRSNYTCVSRLQVECVFLLVFAELKHKRTGRSRSRGDI